MRIAIPFSIPKDPRIGGAYYYKKTILTQLLKSNIPHDFFLISENRKEEGSLKETFPTAQSLCISEYEPLFLKLLKNCIYIPILRRWTQPIVVKKNRDVFISLIKKNKIDLVYYTGQMECLEPSMPFISTNWDLGHITIKNFPEIKVEAVQEKRVHWYSKTIFSSSAVFVESDAGKDEMIKYLSYPEDKIFVIPFFIDPDEWLLRRGINNYTIVEHKYLFYPAQFWPHKNHENLIDAYNLLYGQNKLSGIKLVLSGSDKGNVQKIKDKIATLKLQDEIILTDFINREDIIGLYQNALALVMPTYLGPTNLPILEALEAECPIICSDLSGHREMAQDAALYFDPSNHLDIAEKMFQLIANKNLQVSLIKNAKKVKLSSKFNHKKATEALENAFSKIEKEMY